MLSLLSQAQHSKGFSCEIDLNEPTNPESVKTIDELRLRVTKAMKDNFLGGAIHPDDEETKELMNYRRWLEQIKTSFDPNLVAEYCVYPTPGVKSEMMVE